MMRRLERYLLREIAPYFGLAFLVSTGLVLASQMAEFSELFMKRDVPPELVRALLLWLTPRILVLALPLSLLAAVMTGLGRLHGDHELTALFSSGIGRWRLLPPLLPLILPICAVTFYLVAFGIPYSMQQVREIRTELVLQGIRVHLKPRVFDDRFAGKILYIGDIDRHRDIWRGVFLALEEPRPDTSPPTYSVLITAERGQLELGRTSESAHLILYQGTIHRRPDADPQGAYDVEAFERMRVRFDVRSQEALRLKAAPELGPSSTRERIQEMTLPELWAARHDPVLGRRARTEFHKRLAVSVSPLLVTALGVALGTTRRRGGRGYGFGLSLLLAAFYYLLLLAGENMARAGRLPPSVALWGGNLFLALYSFAVLSERYSLSRTLEKLAERLGVTSEALPPLRARIASGWDDFRTRLRRLADEVSEHLVRLLRPRRESVASFRYAKIGIVRFPLSIADRYMAERFLSLYLTVLVGLWTLFILFTVFELSSDILANQIPARFVAEYLVFLSPSVLSYLAPPSALIAALASMSILSQSGELTALRAAGVSLYRASLPLLLASSALALAVALWQEHIVPEANARQELLRFYIKKGRFPAEIELAPTSPSAHWLVLHSGGEPTRSPQVYWPQRLFHYASFDRATRRIMAPQILEFSSDAFFIRRRIQADFAQWDDARAAWLLIRASVWEFERSRLLVKKSFDRLWLPEEGGLERLMRRPRKPEQMSGRELQAQIRLLEAQGFDSRDVKIALERRFANAAAVIVMALLGIPFGVTFGRKGARQAIGLGVGIGLLYWFALGLFEQLGRYEYFSPRVAAWSPNGVLTALSLYLLFRIRT